MVIMAGTKNINKTDSSPDSSFILESVWINLVKKGDRKTSYHEKGSIKLCDNTFKLMSRCVQHAKST